jgi:hypothetical protein
MAVMSVNLWIRNIHPVYIHNQSKSTEFFHHNRRPVAEVISLISVMETESGLFLTLDHAYIGGNERDYQ